MQQLVTEIKAYINMLTGMEISEFYYDWNIMNRSGALIAISKNKIKEKDSIPSAKDLHGKISVISAEVQRAPNTIEYFWLSDRVVFVVREGILIRLEKELILQGYSKIL